MERVSPEEIAVRQSNLARTLATTAASIAGASVATWFVIPNFGGRAPIGIFLLVIAIEATTVGLLPGLFATILSLIAAHLFFADSISLVLERYSLLSVLTVCGIVASYLGSRTYQANLAVRQARVELGKLNKQLAEYAELLASADAKLRSANLAQEVDSI